MSKRQDETWHTFSSNVQHNAMSGIVCERDRLNVVCHHSVWMNYLYLSS